MNKNTKITQLDPKQIEQRIYDEDMDAQRVVLVGGEKLNISLDNNKIVNAISEGFSKLKIEVTPNQIKDVEFVTIEKPIIVEKFIYKEIEKPVIVTNTEYKTIEIPIIVKEIELKEIIREKHYPKILKICAIIQAISVIGLLLINLIKR